MLATPRVFCCCSFRSNETGFNSDSALSTQKATKNTTSMRAHSQQSQSPRIPLEQERGKGCRGKEDARKWRTGKGGIIPHRRALSSQKPPPKPTLWLAHLRSPQLIFQAEFPKDADAEHRPPTAVQSRVFLLSFRRFPKGIPTFGSLAEQTPHFVVNRHLEEALPAPPLCPPFSLHCHLLHPSIQTGQTGNSDTSRRLEFPI